MIRLPVPLNTISSRAKTTPSTSLFSSKTALVREFSVPSARVMNTLSALSTSIAADLDEVTDTPFSTSCTLSSLLTFTVTVPSSSVPDRIYVPASVMVRLSVSVISFASSASQVPARSRLEK